MPLGHFLRRRIRLLTHHYAVYLPATPIGVLLLRALVGARASGHFHTKARRPASTGRRRRVARWRCIPPDTFAVPAGHAREIRCMPPPAATKLTRACSVPMEATAANAHARAIRLSIPPAAIRRHWPLAVLSDARLSRFEEARLPRRRVSYPQP